VLDKQVEDLQVEEKQEVQEGKDDPVVQDDAQNSPVAEITASLELQMQLVGVKCSNSAAAAGHMPQSAPHLPVAEQRAWLHTLPGLTDLISDCWQQRDLRRPTAGAVQARLQALLESAEAGDTRPAP
jgi:hypothetical protein